MPYAPIRTMFDPPPRPPKLKYRYERSADGAATTAIEVDPVDEMHELPTRQQRRKRQRVITANGRRDKRKRFVHPLSVEASAAEQAKRARRISHLQNAYNHTVNVLQQPWEHPEDTDRMTARFARRMKRRDAVTAALLVERARIEHEAGR